MIGNLGELILYVEDMSAQVVFYRDILGLRVVEPTDTDQFEEAYWVLFDAGGCKLALHGGGKRRFGEDAPKFVFYVEDIEAARSHLVSAGIQVGDTRSPAQGVYVVDAVDPEGNLFSLEQRQ